MPLLPSYRSHIAFASAQNLAQITVSNTGTDNNFYFLVDRSVFINIGKDGNIIEWGTPLQEGRLGYYPGKLEPFIGRVDYYNRTDNEAFRGKPKYIGSAAITYYSSYENENFSGKVKSIGSVTLAYYDAYENEAYKGKLKNAGNVAITYYASYDNSAFRSKLKSVGGTTLSYYSTNDDKAFKGKLKSLGGNNYTYYSSFEQREYVGIIKMGSQKQMANGINYILKF